ncbi:MAG: GTPase ObgE [Vulcanimicrobiaceae bacterium]
MQFIDEATIELLAGNGGDGTVGWRREKYVPKGGPAGGDGGHGASIAIEATSALSTLVEFRYKRRFEGESGKAGGTSNKSGKAGADLTIFVPVGTLVFVTPENGGERLLADLADPGAHVIAAKGGRGGLGNQHFATSTRQAPHFAEKGAPGEHVTLRFELRLLADCGIVGVPNAGKSTLLSAISAARPKVADYPFTTLEPHLGVVRVSEEESFVAVDVPGLIEGAHDGAGLGDRFLRHVERTRVLVHLLDGAKPLDELLLDKTMIDAELLAWNRHLLDKPMLLVVNKLDLPDARQRLDEIRERFGAGVLGISGATGEGVSELVYATARAIRAAPLPELDLPESAPIQLKPKDAFRIERADDGTFVVTGERVERLAAMTDFDSDEALARFERTLAKMGVEKRLRASGVAEGDTVRIGTYEFTYS